jgi:DNA-binding CsgD family transcriptional regulator
VTVMVDRATLVGRDRETAAIDRLLTGAREGHSGALVLRGEAGIGKSALLEYARERATDFTVLRGAGIESESELAYAALHQILRPIFDRIERLPAPQAAALRAAFALSTETVEERFRVSLGVLGLLAEVAEERPLVCLVDDAQWVDRASADALVFTARRLTAEPLVLMFGARDDEERPFAAPGLAELRPSALSGADSRSLLIQGHGPDIAGPAVDWLLANCNGNPLALLELPNGLSSGQLSGHESLTAHLPPATSVEQVYLERLGTLTPSARTLLVLAAADELGSRATIQRAAIELGLEIAELAGAESAGLLTIDSERVSFRHPLVRSAIYRSATFTEREFAHGTLATASAAEGNADRAAWHRAAATVGTDEDLARDLESTAERARLRSGHAAASAALERAAELSPDDEPRSRRLVGAATTAWHAGQPERALALAEQAEALLADAGLCAELDHVRGDIEQRCGALLDAGTMLLSAAAGAAAVDSRKTLEILFDAASCGMQSGDYTLVVEAGRRAAALPRGDDEESTFLADLLTGVGSLWLDASSRDVPLVLDVIARAERFDKPRLLSGAAMGAGTIGDYASEAALLRRSVALARASGAMDSLTLALLSTAVAGVLAGRLTVAPEATEGLTLASEAGLTGVASFHRAILGWLAAARGDDDECRSACAEVAKTAAATRNALANSIAEWAIALLDLSRGRPEQTVTRLVALGEASPGFGHPLILIMSAADLVEAAVRTDRGAQARAAQARLDGFAQPGAPTWALALAARCRALVAEGADAEHEFTEALRLAGEINRPFDRARTELSYGAFLRRQRRRTDSREHLRAAVEAFDELGAAGWAECARTELRASGETARRRDPSTIAQLTPQELQIVRLVAEGASNKEAAAHLFLSPRTIEYHLRKVFMKLGISSRSELIKLRLGQGDPIAETALGVSA